MSDTKIAALEKEVNLLKRKIAKIKDFEEDLLSLKSDMQNFAEFRRQVAHNYDQMVEEVKRLSKK